MTMRDALTSLSPAFSIPSKSSVLADLGDRVRALVPSYRYGDTSVPIDGPQRNLDRLLDTLAEYMVNPYTSTQAPFDYAMPEQAAVGWMMGGYEGTGPFGKGLYASTRVFLVWAPWWQASQPYLLLTTPMQVVSDGALVEEIPDHISRCALRPHRTLDEAMKTLGKLKMGKWKGCSSATLL